jgi:hypothetical protein
MNGDLLALETQVRADLARTAHPTAAWLEPKTAPDGRPALDVLVVGAGQSGLAIGFGLLRSQVSNILVLDKVEAGLEGPWLTYARMPRCAARNISPAPISTSRASPISPGMRRCSAKTVGRGSIAFCGSIGPTI